MSSNNSSKPSQQDRPHTPFSPDEDIPIVYIDGSRVTIDNNPGGSGSRTATGHIVRAATTSNLESFPPSATAAPSAPQPLGPGHVARVSTTSSIRSIGVEPSPGLSPHSTDARREFLRFLTVCYRDVYSSHEKINDLLRAIQLWRGRQGKGPFPGTPEHIYYSTELRKLGTLIDNVLRELNRAEELYEELRTKKKFPGQALYISVMSPKYTTKNITKDFEGVWEDYGKMKDSHRKLEEYFQLAFGQLYEEPKKK